MTMNARALHKLAAENIPGLPIKPTSTWIAILFHTKTNLSEIKGESDFQWLKCHERITVRTLQYHYFARHPLEDFEFKHESKDLSYFPKDLLQVKHLRKKNGFNGNVVVLRALEGDEVNNEKRIDEQKAAAQSVREVIEVSEDEDEVNVQATLRDNLKNISNHDDAERSKHDENGFRHTVSISDGSLKISDLQKHRDGPNDPEHWEGHDEVSTATLDASCDFEQENASAIRLRATKRKRHSSTPKDHYSDDDGEHNNLSLPVKRATLDDESPTAEVDHEVRMTDDDMESRDLTGSTVIEEHEQRTSSMSTPHYTNDNFDGEMELQMISETLTTHDALQDLTADFSEPPPKTADASEMQICGVPSCQKHFYLSDWTKYGPGGVPLCALCSEVFINRYGDEQGLMDFENLTKTNFYVKCDRARQGFPQNMDDDDAPLDHPALLGHASKVNDDIIDDNTGSKSSEHAHLSRASREASIRSAESFRTAGEHFGERKMGDSNLVNGYNLDFIDQLGLPETQGASSPYRSLSPLISLSDLVELGGRSAPSPGPVYRGPHNSPNSVQSAASDRSPGLDSSGRSRPFMATTRNNHSPTTFLSAVSAHPANSASVNNCTTATFMLDESHAISPPWGTMNTADLTIDPAIFNITSTEDIKSEDTDTKNGFFGDADNEPFNLTSYPTLTSINHPTAGHPTTNGRIGNTLTAPQPETITSSTVDYTSSSSSSSSDDDDYDAFDPDAFAAEVQDVEAAKAGDAADDDYTESESEPDEDF